MTRYRILAVLLTLTAFSTGWRLGAAPWHEAFVPLAVTLVLAYLAFRPDRYTPDAPVYGAGRLEQIRKWARRSTLLGFYLFGGPVLLLMMLTMLGRSDVIAKIPISVLAAVSNLAPLLASVLILGGLAAWTFAVGRSKKQKAGETAAP